MKSSKSLAERRASKRTPTAVEITGFTSLDHMTLISRKGYIVDASVTGFCLALEHRDIVPKELRESLTLEMLHGDRVLLFIPYMHLELAGYVVRTRLVGKKRFEIAIDYSEDAPDYWRECLVELLPKPGEIE